ncbi:hypothetical protein ScPMuIL_013976 [Solemya velum]
MRDFILHDTSTKVLHTIWRRLKHSASKSPKRSKKFSETLNLPQTDFPLSIRNGAAIKRETKIQQTCSFDALYKWQQEQDRDEQFVLHDGPPYANGTPHVGHAINKILKDVTNRYKLLRGYKVHYVPGWDCHGLPIELKALAGEKKQHLTPLQIRDRARKFAQKTIDLQQEAFRSWGVMADWDKYYTTYSREYQINQLDVFHQMYDKDLIYRDVMPVYWSPSSRTALAEAELEYNNEHCSQSVYIKFPVVQPSPHLQELTGSAKNLYAVIWTTTPWTLPANRAIAYNSHIQYCLLKEKKTNTFYICEESFKEKLGPILETDLQQVNSFEGSCLASSEYKHPLTMELLPFLPAVHVAPDKGTGLVHTAPAHGHDDFRVAKKHGVSVKCMVDEAGLYMPDAGSDLAGLNVLEDANQRVVELLGDNVLQVEDYIHSYPYDWRTKRPVIIRASRQWFVDTHKLKDQAVDSMKHVNIIPKSSEHGMLSQLASRTYWCISRQRVWGLPIPVFYHRHSNQTLLNSQTVDHIQKLFLEHGTDCWWSLSQDQLLPDGLVKQLGLGESADYVKGEDILDIWFDSGTSWASLLKDVGDKADVYMEGLDQFGGWFQSSLLTSVALRGHAPYRNLVVHGFTMDEEGHKMSKSLGNVVDPKTVIHGDQDHPSYGVDVLRWWAAHSHLQSKVLIGSAILEKCNDEIFKVRKTLRFLLGNVHDYDSRETQISYSDLWPQDKYMLLLLSEFGKEVTKHYDSFNYSKVLQVVEKFLSSHVSSFYCHMTKDRCYCGERQSLPRLASQTVQQHILEVVTMAIAPILPHLAEEVHQCSRRKVDKENNDRASLFRSRWYKVDGEWGDTSIRSPMEVVLGIRDHVNSIIGAESPVEFDLVIYSTGQLFRTLEIFQPAGTASFSPLNELMQTSKISLTDKSLRYVPDDAQLVEGTLAINGVEKNERYVMVLSPAMGHFCERCRRYTSKSANCLCNRCHEAIKNDSS